MEVGNASSLDEDPPLPVSTTTSSEFRWPSPWWLSFVVVCLIGILFNCSTFWKSVTTRKRGSPTTRVSLSLLCVMAGADTACLLALLFTLSLRYLGIENGNILSFACRFNLFVIHSASAFSLYCWLILSLVRYVAVFSPYKHLRLNREPILATLSIGAVICLLEFYVFYEVTFDEQYRACHSRREQEVERRIEIAEIIGSYFIPLIVITTCDAKVLLFRATWSRENSLLRKSQEDRRKSGLIDGSSPDRLSIASDDAEPSSTGNYQQTRYSIVKSDQLFAKPKRSLRRFRQFRALRRALAISIFDLLLNLPNYLFRLYISIAKESPFSQETTDLVENISQLMYFGQFSLNAFYLVCLIYDSPRRKKGIPVSNQHSYAQTYTTSILSTQPSMKWQRSLQRHGVHRKSTPANAGLLMEP